MNKKKSIVVLAILLLTCIALGLAACSHQHQLTHHQALEPTCAESGMDEYWSCECGKMFSDEAGTQEIAQAPVLQATGHSFVIETVKTEALKSSATCYSKAVYYKSCACGEISQNENDTFEAGEFADHNYIENIEATGAKVSDATCTDPAIYKKSCSVCCVLSDETFKHGSALGHDEEIAWSWTAKDGSYDVTATVSCTRCEHTKVYSDGEVIVTSKQTQTPTCTEEGKLTYTATITVENSQISDTKVDDIDVISHTYGTVTFTWSKDHSSCTATRTCSCGNKQTATATVSAEVTQKATADLEEITTYTAVFSEEWADSQIEVVTTGKCLEPSQPDIGGW